MDYLTRFFLTFLLSCAIFVDFTSSDQNPVNPNRKPFGGLPESLKHKRNPNENVKARWRSAKEYQDYYNNPKNKGNKWFTDGFMSDSPWTDFFVGNPPNYYILSVETGFDKTWLIHPNYPNLQDDQKVYNADNSKTSQTNPKDQFGTSGIYTLYGPAYTDLFFDEKTWWNQSFGNVLQVYSKMDEVAPAIPFDGVMGLAWDPNGPKTADDNSSIIFHLLKDKPKKIVSLWQERDAMKDFGVYHQFLLGIGWIESDLCSPNVTYIPVNFDYFNTLLSFNVDAFKFDSYATKRPQLGKVDSGLATIFLPDAPYKAIYRILDPDYDWDRHVLTTDCSNVHVFKDWVFTIAGRDFALSASDYLVDIFLPDNKCVLAMELSTDYWLPYMLGNPFLRRYCQILDVTNNKLGLTDAVHSPPKVVVTTPTSRN